jgi:3-phosphoshikimate 1-carboxyvinyltransferase
VPGDKSISHRALILGALAVGRTRVRNLLEGDDVLRTAAALQALGARIERERAGAWEIHGVGVGGLAEPAEVLDLGNSGTGARLLMGVVATHPFTTFFSGDDSLRRRPMARVIEPLTLTGARFVARDGGRLPLAIVGAAAPMPITYTLPVPSAQVKSAALLAGLNAPGETTVIEPIATRDHTENLLRHFGAAIDVAVIGTGARRITLIGQPELTGTDLIVPSDPSSAAFPVVAALIRPGSAITVEGVGINPLRAGLYRTLAEMGARLTWVDERIAGGERVADIKVDASDLHGVEVPAERAPSMIDEYPVLAVAAAFAKGRTVMHGLGELRVKESDRLTAIAEGLRKCGVAVTVAGDTLTVDGKGSAPKGGAQIATRLDHRIAMAFLVLGGAARKPVRIDDGETMATSFPGFVKLLNRLGARIVEVKR